MRKIGRSMHVIPDIAFRGAFHLRDRRVAVAPIALCAAALLTGAGCQTPARESAAVPIPPSAASEDLNRQRSAAPSLDSFALFGDDPAGEPLPDDDRTIGNFVRHTFTSDGNDFDPDTDADGKTLAFASTRNSERPDIYLLNLDGVGVTQLNGDPADDIQPRFSPDGKRVVFCSNRTGNWDVWMVDRDGRNVTQLTYDRTDEMSPSWSPDGARLAFSVWGQRSHQWELWVMDVAQPAARRFLAYGMFPAWSPDGHFVAYQRARQRGSRQFSIWTIELIGDEARHPTEVAQGDAVACISPRWSPDGEALIYCTVPIEPSSPGRPAINADLWTVNLHSGSRVRLTDGASPSFNPVWSRDGHVYYVSARAGSENIWSLASDDTRSAAAKEPGERMTRAGPAGAKDE